MSKKIKNELNEKYYSLIGKISFQKYPILLLKDKIVNGVQKKFKTKDIFTPDEPKTNNKIDEYFTLFSKYQLTAKNYKNSNKKKKSKVELVCKLMKNNPKLVYHNRHLYSENKKKEFTLEIDTFSYAPKYNYIRPRLLSGPCWKNPKDKKRKKVIKDNRNYYISQKDLNMNKTTQRGDFIDIKLRSEKNLDNRKIENNNKYKYKNIPLFIRPSTQNKKNHIKIPTTTRNKKNYNEKLNDKFSKTDNNFYIKSKNKKIFFEEEEKNKFHKRNINISIYNNSSNRKINKDRFINSITKRQKSSIKNNAPDFSKILSRDQVEKVKGHKSYEIPLIVPNYSLVRERSLTMTIYKKYAKIIKNHKPKAKDLEGVDYAIKFDPDKYITKCNNHINLKGPNFNNMLSRFYSEKQNTLPSYMSNIYDRGSMNRITEKALKMNKFKEGKMTSAISSFIPKKSFNKIININMINSHNFKENINDDFITERKEILKNDIERKNKEDEIEYLKDLGTLTQFENFTYKTIPYEKKSWHDSSYENSKNGIYKSLKKLLSGF